MVAQVLTYAAYLHGVERAELERIVLGGHLQRRGYENLISLDPIDFDEPLALLDPDEENPPDIDVPIERLT